MGQFLKIVFGSCLGFIFSWFVITIIGISVIVGLADAGMGDDFKEQKNKENTILVMGLNNIDQRSPVGFMDFSSFDFFGDRKVGLNDILQHIETAKFDANVKAIYIDLNRVYTGWTNLEAVREALVDFKSNGKQVYAFGDGISNRSYYLATVADKVYMSPTGSILFNGFSATRMYMKGALEKLGVEMQIFKYGKYKSAVEPFIREDMSDAAKEQTLAYLESTYGHYLRNIAQDRKVIGSDLHRMADEFLIRNPKDAMEYHLIDGVRYKDEMIAELVTDLGVEDEEKINFQSLGSYVVEKEPKSIELDKTSPKVAIVYAEGEINMYPQKDGKNISPKQHAKAIRQARKDTSVKAIVLRINSPGGSALASDIIWREVTLAKKEKPVIVSMGEYAASGGYYIACPADKIVADPMTMTGSIGVFGMIPYTGGFMKDKLGLTFDGVKTAEHADLGNITRRFTEKEGEIIQQGVNEIYEDFIGKVAEGRGLTVEQVDAIGQGRIWSGIQAQSIGLVDTLGGLNVALDIANKMIGNVAADIVEYPKRSDNPLEAFMGQIGSGMKAKVLEVAYSEEYQLLEEAKKLLETEDKFQAILPFKLEVN